MTEEEYFVALPADKMELNIKVLSGETKTVYVDPGATIGELKHKVAQLFNASPVRMKLSITNGRVVQLDNNQMTVNQYGLSSGATVMLLITIPLQVFVKNEKGQTKTYDITEEETVDQLMRKVRQKDGTPEDQQRLKYGGKQLEPGTSGQN
ncbi:hypothetical protein QTP70_013637 [Hemibagrus guttatus]|uniref:Ubiquitin-like domain-containing protein n=1 Tax=Hemibagrus guttatus TaxID=175788 RepID=A0AAE0UQZ1_9TELE|nr:hypothetical protein QTP70_013637 [Hemibagrus guttatus]